MRAEAGEFRPGQTVVCILTGHGLKDPDTAVADAPPVLRIRVDAAPTSSGRCSMAESLVVTAPATSANLGPGFDVLAAALDFTNAVVITRRPGPLAVRVTGEGAGDVARATRPT